MSDILTRAEYIKNYHGGPEGTALHRRFYAQFVNDQTINHVLRHISGDKLLASTDESFNDIPMREWDNAAIHPPMAIKFAAVGDFPSAAGLVCVLKEAARQYVESRQA